MNATHKYRIRGTSTTLRSGLAVAEGIEPTIAFSVPLEFKGHAGHWTPEHLFVAAAASCYISTFSGMAFNSNLEFFSLELESEGILTEDHEGWRFLEIVIRPRLLIGRADQKSLGSRLLQKAEDNCLVCRSLACQIVLESALVIGDNG
jgi:peroxiredoxin-like protein